ncbi:MAG: alcohol dehydrogenase catalytic domain-containing protein [Planctomycetota bacterium]|nr:alcohol dehydrogenase catalytic domain-containing protein [Planctomycetota bacterium]
MTLPTHMHAAVYRGRGEVRLEQLPVPTLERGELLVRVAACGVCGTDLKKVELGLVEPPRVFGHETAGVIVATRETGGGWSEGDRVALYHHVPDRDSWYGRRRLYAQCPRYKQTGIGAGFEPAGGGYAEYVRVQPWIVTDGGLTAVPDDVSLERATWIEPVNTCLKGVRQLGIDEGDVVLVTGLGSIGLILVQLAAREGATIIASDPLPGRRQRALALGAGRAVDPSHEDLAAICREATAGRGADHAIVAAPGGAPVADALAATRPGATILLFANTRVGESASIDLSTLCVGERKLVGSYSASVDLTEETARIVFDAEIDVDALVTHRFPLAETAEAMRRAAIPADEVLKVMVVQAGSADVMEAADD